eukprot:gene9392-biopygen9346
MVGETVANLHGERGVRDRVGWPWLRRRRVGPPVLHRAVAAHHDPVGQEDCLERPAVGRPAAARVEDDPVAVEPREAVVPRDQHGAAEELGVHGLGRGAVAQRGETPLVRRAVAARKVLRRADARVQAARGEVSRRERLELRIHWAARVEPSMHADEAAPHKGLVVHLPWENARRLITTSSVQRSARRQETQPPSPLGQMPAAHPGKLANECLVLGGHGADQRLARLGLGVVRDAVGGKGAVRVVDAALAPAPALVVHASRDGVGPVAAGELGVLRAVEVERRRARRDGQLADKRGEPEVRDEEVEHAACVGPAVAVIAKKDQRRCVLLFSQLSFHHCPEILKLAEVAVDV